MKKKPILLTLFTAMVLPAMADTFVLKDGTALEATILKETPESYELQVQVTKSIRDERTILKSDIAKVTRELPDMKAFEKISGLVPAPDFLTSGDYSANIAAVQAFLKEHRTSSKIAEANAILATLKAEAAQIAEGSIKIGGKVVSPAEYRANAYDFDARMLEAKIRALVDDRQLIPALRAFADFDRDYRTTLSYGQLEPLAMQLIQSYINEAEQSLELLDRRIKERQVGLERMTAESSAATKLAIEEEALAIEARFKSEKESKVGWVTTSPYHKESLVEAIRFGEAEITRIKAVKTTLGVDGGRAYRELYSAVKNGAKAATVASAAAAAKTALVPTRYTAPLEEEAKARK